MKIKKLPLILAIAILFFSIVGIGTIVLIYVTDDPIYMSIMNITFIGIFLCSISLAFIKSYKVYK